MFACVMIRGAREAPQSYATADSLLAALTPYDQDDLRGHWANDQMLMVQALTWNTPESRHEAAPETCKDTGRVIVSWVRLDNRATLCAKLGLSDSIMLTDPQIILESHRKWGADCADQLEGDFSFVIYDPARETVFCARDSIGAKPFFYYADAEVFVAASTAAIFRGLKKLSITPSQEWIARQLTSIPHVVTKSAYDNVMRLAPAHSLTVAREGSVDPHEYFRFKDMAPVADTRDPAYVDAYREAFHKAVEVRLRSDFLIGAENSGGLDSVSIMGHAVKHLPHDIEDFHCFGLPKMERDQELIVDASVHAKVRHTHLATQMKGPADPENFERAIKTLGHPVEHSQINVHMSGLRQSEAFGIRTMLSGYGGDEIVTNQAGAIDLELYANRQFKALLNEMPGNALTTHLRFIKRLHRLNHQDSFSQKYLRILRRNLKYTPVRAEVLEDLGIRSYHENQIAHAAEAKTLNDQILRQPAFCLWRVSRLEACATMALSHRIEYRWPLYDRHLMQQYLQTPAIEKRHKAIGRYLHRRAIAGTIPDKIAWQLTKNTGHTVTKAFSQQKPHTIDGDSLPHNIAVLLDFDRLGKLYADVANAKEADMLTERFLIGRRTIWTADALSRWLRHH